MPLLRFSGVFNSSQAFRVMEDDFMVVEKHFEPPGDEKYRRAAHAMFFARCYTIKQCWYHPHLSRTEEKLWDKHPYVALVNMHLRYQLKTDGVEEN